MPLRKWVWQEPGAAASRWMTLAIVVLIAAICASPVINDIRRIGRQDTGDFVHFYYAADAMARHADPYAAWTQGYIYPPLIAFIFQPLTRLGRDHAAGVMLALNVSLTLTAVLLASREFLRRFGGSQSPPAVASVMLLSILMNIDKIKGEWQMWQTDVFMLLLFVLALRWIDRRPIAAGLMLGIAVNIKYLPLLFLPYLLIRRRWTAAASLVLGSIALALLPAVSTGWTANLRNWRTATNGLVEMTGAASSHREAAEIHDVTDSLSCSITSALARVTQRPAIGFPLAAIVAASALAISWLIYRSRRLPMFTPIRHPATPDAATAVEWVMLLSAILAFSPQTNTRHLYDALLLTTAAATLLIFASESVNRIPLLVGCTVLILGFVLPPGHRTRVGEHTATIDWLRYGGPCWCLLVAAMTVMWTGVQTGIEDRGSRIAD